MNHSDVDYTRLSILELRELYKSRQVRPTQVLEACLERISRLNGPFDHYESTETYNAMVRLFEREARIQARHADEQFEQWVPGTQGPPLLCGIPIAIKENIYVEGHACVMGAPDLFAGNIAASDATVVEKLRQAEAVILGYAIASRLTQNVEGMFAGNAWDIARSPGGSSQGSGVSPLIGFCVAALGGETGGSMTMPASANGTSAIKPSSGLISVEGVMPMLPGIDVVGPMARSMQDAAILMNAVMGLDDRDPLTLEAPIPPLKMPIYPRIDRQPLRGVKIGVPQRDWMRGFEGRPPRETYSRDYQTVFDQLIIDLAVLGAEICDFPGLDISSEDDNPFYERSLGDFPLVMPIFSPIEVMFPITPAQAICHPNSIEWGWIARFRDIAETLPGEDRDVLLRSLVGIQEPIGQYVMSNIYLREEGHERLERLRSNYLAALKDRDIDFMLFLELGDHPSDKNAPGGSDLPLKRRYYELENAMGWPVVTFPVGHREAPGLENAPALGPVEMPISASFWGPRFSDAMLVQAVLDYQDHYRWHHKLPEVSLSAIATT